MKMTIVVPTRSRASTLRQTLLTCTQQSYGDLEILVSDNCSDDDTEAVARSTGDPRVRYLRTPRRVSMRENFEFSLSHVTGGFVGFMGDDDGLFPGAIEKTASFIRASGASAVTSVLGFYRWPCAPESIRNSGSLQFCPAGDEIRSSAEFVGKALRGLGAYYVHDLPSLYYGFADLSLTAPREGSFFNSITPDAYSAFAISAQVSEYGYLGEPLFIVGASGRSNGVSTFVKDARKEEGKDFSMSNDIPFHDDYLRCNSLAVCIHESFAQACRRYPGLAKSAGARPQDLIRYMAREATAENREELLSAAVYFADKSGVAASEVRRAFSPLARGIDKMAVSLRKRLNVARNRRVVATSFRNMQAKGVEDVFQAAHFFQNEIERMKPGRRQDG